MAMQIDEFLHEWNDDSTTLLVHTSGSTGTPKPLWVEKRRMEASARITCRFLGLTAGQTALLCLPLDYIAGKMMVVRSLVAGLRLVAVEPSSHPLAQLPPMQDSIDFAAMVPLQVWQSLQQDEERQRLRAIRQLIIGGGAVDDRLEAALRDFPHGVWSTYGMTETLSHIALRRINGAERSDWYKPFEGIGLSLTAEGCLGIDAPALHDGLLVTNDRAELRSDGCFRILGRRDNVICSGGIKIQMEEVERLLRAHTDLPLMVTRAPHPVFGQQVVLLTESADRESLRRLCQRCLPRYWQPRSILTVDRLPMTRTGKPARMEAEQLAVSVSTFDAQRQRYE